MTQTGGTEWAVEAKRLGAELRRQRIRAGLTMRGLASLVPMTHTYLLVLERGEAGPASTHHWLPLVAKAAIDERVRWEASLRISALELQERVEDRVAAHVSRKMGMDR